MSQFRIPSPSQFTLGQKGKAPYISGTQFVSGAKFAATAAIYGIGINKAITEFKLSNKEFKDYDVPITEDLPDAYKDEKGFKRTERWDGYMSSSLLGMPVMCYIRFIGGIYTDLQGKQVTIPEIFLETVLFNVTLNKRIKKTDITGRDDGSVKEYIGKGDYNVEMRAIVSATAPVNSSVQKRSAFGVYPRENMSELIRLFDAPIALPIDCWYLNQFGIEYMVVDEGGVQIDMLEGEYDEQRIVVPFLSDKPLVIKIIDA